MIARKRQQTDKRKRKTPAAAAIDAAGKLPSSVPGLRATLGDVLRRYRMRRGLTQEQVGKAAGVSLKYVGEIERGEANATVETIERIASQLDCNISVTADAHDVLTEPMRQLLIMALHDRATGLTTLAKWLESWDRRTAMTSSLPPAPVAVSDVSPIPASSRPRARAQGRRQRA